LGFFAIVCLQLLYSQDKVSYGYDAAGNRTSRTIIYAAPPSPAPAEPQEDEAPPAVYSEMLSDIEIKIYPNPTDGLLKVEILNLPEKQTANIWLYNLSGKLITSFRRITDFANIDISEQPTGTYLMKIVAGKNQTEWKIIKK
jgi:hypothetical protein